MDVRVSGRENAKPGGTAGIDPVPAEMQGRVFYCHRKYQGDANYNSLFSGGIMKMTLLTKRWRNKGSLS